MNCLTKLLLPLFVILSLFPAPLPAQENSNRIVEQVGVNCWLVPVMAIDKKGEAVIDLKAGDIEVYINNKPITNFTFIKSVFDMSEQVETQKQEPERKKKPAPPVVREKVVFLVFDQALSRTSSILRSKGIARAIITNADPNTRFVVMAIRSFAGLSYIAQGKRGDPKLMEFIEKKIRKFNNARTVNVGIFSAPAGGKRGQRVTAAEKAFKRREAAAYYTRKCITFFNAFETLYFHLNGIDTSKFVYLFSEGVPNDFIRAVPGGIAFYDIKLKQAANHLGRSGAVLFLVNPLGVDEGSDVVSKRMSDVVMTHPVFDETGDKVMSFDGPASGRYSMQSLATKSGGKYLEGTRERIVQRIRGMHRAYYEISFPDIKDARGVTRNISIKSKRKGVTMVTLRSIEGKKTYSRMNTIEKELLALNLVTGSPLVRRRITAFQAAVDKVKKKKSGATYTVLLPKSFVGKSLDLYRFGLKQESGGEPIKSLVKETLKAKKNIIKVRLDSPKGKEAGKTRQYFVLVEPGSNQARVFGAYRYEDSPEYFELQARLEEKNRTTKRKSGKTIEPGELRRILTGCAGYCERLKQSAFHFFCNESIVETLKPLNTRPGAMPDISVASQKRGGNRQLHQVRENISSRVNTYRFTYRLIKNGPKVKEEREWLSSHDNVKVSRGRVAPSLAFISEKAVFAPITLLDKSRQDRYKYTFLRYDRWKGRKAVVIEAVPKDSATREIAVYGDVWIDLEDFSVLKIEADPRSINGYGRLKELAKRLHTRLRLSLETEFGKRVNGIRFPTCVSNLEKYRGGRAVSRYKRGSAWERSRTVFTYSGYQFFNVQVDVSVH
jgi:VWFA-related protein